MGLMGVFCMVTNWQPIITVKDTIVKWSTTDCCSFQGDALTCFHKTYPGDEKSTNKAAMDYKKSDVILMMTATGWECITNSNTSIKSRSMSEINSQSLSLLFLVILEYFWVKQPCHQFSKSKVTKIFANLTGRVHTVDGRNPANHLGWC